MHSSRSAANLKSGSICPLCAGSEKYRLAAHFCPACAADARICYDAVNRRGIPPAAPKEEGNMTNEFFENPEIQKADVPKERAVHDGVIIMPSVEVQAREVAESFEDHPQLQYSAWLTATPAQRLNMLQQVENMAAEISYRPAVEVASKGLADGRFAGCYQHDRGQIGIQPNLLIDASLAGYTRAMQTVLQEGRYAYQYLCVDQMMHTGACLEPDTKLASGWLQEIQGHGFPTDSRALRATLHDAIFSDCDMDASYYTKQVMKAIGLSYRSPDYMDLG